MNRFLLTISVVVVMLVPVFSQDTDDWINYDQEYYKMKVAEDGIYRLSAAEMQSAGIPVSTIVASRYQMFRRGVEIAIRVESSNNRVDFIEFYGQKNRGEIDTPLYIDPDAQPHTYYNLFSDSAAYFLTWKLINESGRRISRNSNNDATGLSAESYYLKDTLTLLTNDYASGIAFGPGNSLKSEHYDFGEGWSGSGFGRGVSRRFITDIEDAYRLGPGVKMEVVVLGRNNLSHKIDFSVGTDANALSNIGTLEFSGQSNRRFTTSFDWSIIGTGNELTAEVLATGFPDQSERISVSSVKITYPATFETLSGNKRYQLRASEERLYLRIPTTQATSYTIYNISDPFNPERLVAPTSFSDRIEFVVDPSVEDNILYLSNTLGSGLSLEKVLFESVNLDVTDYLIITHPAMRSLVNGQDPILAYENYRSSVVGGSFNVTTLEIEDIYNQYGYGDISPLAIRNLITKAGARNVRNALIIGKGTTVNFDYYRNRATSTLTHYVPTFGFPGSDELFGVTTNNNVSSVHIGRLNVKTSDQVLTYLDKVKEMEALPFDQLWRKNFLQLSGGQNTDELRIFSRYIEDFEQVGEGDFLGGRASNRNKESSSVVEFINVEDKINEGVSLVTFFGHSSSAATDIEIGDVSNPETNYSNRAKYPVFLVNGCNAGEIFGPTLTFGEDWLYTPNLGAVAFIAHADFALSSSLKQYSSLFYQNAFGDENNFGDRVGDILERVHRTYFNIYGFSQTSQSQVYGMVYQGDPAYRVFGAQNPDFDINDDFISLQNPNGGNLTANTPNFQLKLNVKNYGKTTLEPLPIKVTRILPDGTSIIYDQTFDPVKYQDTLYVSLTNDQELQNAGMNIFQISIDPDNEIQEISKINNTAQYEFFLAEGSAIPLFPIDFGTVNSNTVQLKYQSANFLSDTREYILQVDTLATFNSLYLKSFNNTGQLLFTQPLDITSLPDSTAIFWRMRYSDFQSGDDTAWVNSRFSKLISSNASWAQVSNDQFRKNQTTGLSFNNQIDEWNFQESTRPVEVSTHGTSSSLSYEDYRVVIGGLNLLLTENPVDRFCKINTINAVVFDSQNGAEIRPFGINGSEVSNPLVCGRLPQMIHNFTENNVLGTNRYLDSLISVVPNGTSFLLFSFDSVAFSNWDDQLKNSLGLIGIERSAIDGLIDGQPFIALAKKGFVPGEAEVVVSDGSVIPRKEQELNLISQVVSKFSEATITSSIIGPAASWERFDFNVSLETSDVSGFNVIGLDQNNNESVLQAVSRAADNSDLSAIDASIYPRLKLRWFLSDVENQTPPQINGWSVSYQKPPEGMLKSISLIPDVQQEGSVFNRSFEYVNLTAEDFQDSINVVLKMTNVASGNNLFDTLILSGPKAFDTTQIKTSFNTRGQQGTNNLLVRVQVNEVEQYEINNAISFPQILEVEADEINPILDVTFDGNYILSGDIVSPNPLIEIKLKDDNVFLLKDDTTGVSIRLKEPCEGCDFERVSFSSSTVSFTPASENEDYRIEYTPGVLADGRYELRIQAADETGNQSGTAPFEVSFEVINESSISHFYPYPNPFSTNMKFVFTLTGSDLPEAIKVQIMTVGGRVVREISQGEIGAIKIGNNISEFGWDGRDEYGDQLANGVYFYKVFVKKTGEPFKHYNTTADRAFKNGFGKIYLLR